MHLSKAPSMKQASNYHQMTCLLPLAQQGTATLLKEEGSLVHGFGTSPSRLRKLGSMGQCLHREQVLDACALLHVLANHSPQEHSRKAPVAGSSWIDCRLAEGKNK